MTIAVAALDTTVEKQTAVNFLDLVDRDLVNAGSLGSARRPGQVRMNALAEAAVQVVLPFDGGAHLVLHAAVLGGKVTAGPPLVDVERFDQFLAEAVAVVLRPQSNHNVGDRRCLVGGRAGRSAAGKGRVAVGHASSLPLYSGADGGS